jgi:superfamily II DNA/RNA helicase
VVSDYVATLFYIAAELEVHGTRADLLHGSFSLEERIQVFHDFATGTGILLATNGALEGIELPNVSDLVFYDVPRSFVTLQNILRRFDRIGRKGELRIYVLASTGEPHPIDESTRGALGEVVE